MKLISKQRPLSYLWILAIESVICIFLIAGGAAIDLAIYNPPPDKPGFPFPIFMIIGMCISALLLGISLLLVALRIIYLYAKQRK